MKKIPVIIALAFLAIVSCKKTDDNNTPEPNIVVKKLASANQTSSNPGYNTGLTNFEYYPDGKLKKIDQINKRIIEYEYSDSSVIEKTTRYNESLTRTITYKFNSNGLAISATDPNPYSFEYDSQGYLLKEKYPIGYYVDCIVSEIKNGNVSLVSQTKNGSTVRTASYEYYTDKYCTFNNNQAGNTFHEVVGLDFLGKRSVNLVKRYVLNDPQLNYPITYDCTYIYNSNEDVTRMIVNVTGGVVVNVDYTYI
jgi:hypothetical protein